jgi:hypothetical protein
MVQLTESEKARERERERESESDRESDQVGLANVEQTGKRKNEVETGKLSENPRAVRWKGGGGDGEKCDN